MKCNPIFQNLFHARFKQDFFILLLSYLPQCLLTACFQVSVSGIFYLNHNSYPRIFNLYQDVAVTVPGFLILCVVKIFRISIFGIARQKRPPSVFPLWIK